MKGRNCYITKGIPQTFNVHTSSQKVEKVEKIANTAGYRVNKYKQILLYNCRVLAEYVNIAKYSNVESKNYYPHNNIL